MTAQKNDIDSAGSVDSVFVNLLVVEAGDGRNYLWLIQTFELKGWPADNYLQKTNWNFERHLGSA